MSIFCRATRVRNFVRIELALAAVVVALAGCGGGDATSPPPPPPVDQWNVVAGRAWQMHAQTEGYVCVGVQVMTDEYISGFRLASPSTVQNEVLLTVQDTPLTLGPFACGPGSLSTELLYAASRGTTSIEFPTGFGVHVKAGQYVLLNLHLVNATDADVSDSTAVEGRVDSAVDVTTPIDMMLTGTFLINIPSDGLEHTATGSCHTSEEQHLLAFLPMMRSRAVHQKLSLMDNATTQTIYDEDFDWQQVTYSMPTTPIVIPQGDRIQTVCSYINNGGTTETYGESANNESCFDAVYHYPISTAANLYSCAEGESFDIARE